MLFGPAEDLGATVVFLSAGPLGTAFGATGAALGAAGVAGAFSFGAVSAAASPTVASPNPAKNAAAVVKVRR